MKYPSKTRIMDKHTEKVLYGIITLRYLYVRNISTSRGNREIYGVLLNNYNLHKNKLCPYVFKKDGTSSNARFCGPEAQVSFSDQNVSVVCRLRRCRFWRKLFTFSSSSPEPLSQFQPVLPQSILR